MDTRMRALILVIVAMMLPACGGGGGGGGTPPVPPNTSGGLVASFGDIGFVASNPAGFTDECLAIASDGTSMYLVGSRNFNGALDSMWYFEKRALSDGALDAGFLGAGVGISNPSLLSDIPTAVATDGTSLYIVGYDHQVGATDGQWRIEKRNCSDGQTAAGFGTAGAVVVNPSANHDSPQAIAIDGTCMYVVGFDNTPGNDQWRIEKRLLTDGSLVAGFNGTGILQSNPTVSNDAAMAIATDGTNMYVAGHDIIGGAAEFRIEKRLLSSGALVAGFSGGFVTSDPSAGDDFIQAIALDANYIYVAGTDAIPGNQEWRIEKRFIGSGQLVGTFSGGAVTSNPSGGTDRANAISVDASSVYVAGVDLTGGNWQWRVEKRDLTTGAPVAAFGTGGAVTSNPNGVLDDVAKAMVIDANSMYIAGTDQRPGNPEIRVEKRALVDGASDPSFGTPGIAAINVATGSDVVSAMAIDATHLYSAGYDNQPGNAEWRVEKRALATGELDPTFGVGGFVQSNPSANFDEATAIAVTATAIYIGGYDSAPGAMDQQWRVEKRSLTTGALMAAFDGDGVVTVNPSASGEAILAMAADASGLYLIGYDGALGADQQWRIEKRNLTTGALVAAFDGDGIVLTNPSTFQDTAFEVAIDATALYIGGYDSAVGPADSQWRVEKRDLTTGALIGPFGTGGILSVNPDSSGNNVTALLIDGASLFVAGSDNSLGQGRWRVEKRSRLTGQLDAAFGAGGVATSDPTVNADYVSALASDGTSLFVGGYVAPGSFEPRLEKRNGTTGALDSTFGVGGVVSSTVPFQLNGLALDASGLYLGGYVNVGGNLSLRYEKRLK